MKYIRLSGVAILDLCNFSLIRYTFYQYIQLIQLMILLHWGKKLVAKADFHTIRRPRPYPLI